jgi:SH3-like domain-containing protein
MKISAFCGRRAVIALVLMVMQATPILAAAQQVNRTGQMEFAQSLSGSAGQVIRVQAQGEMGKRGAVTNLPLPRYVSLKGNEGNARRGPSLSHRIDWVFRHAGMPLRVTAEFGHWRRVEDKDGAGGWVHYALLSGVRTALVTEDMVELRSKPNRDADIMARAETGAIVRLGECIKDWCRVSGGGQRGWVPKTTIWGVDPDETRE